MKLIQLSEEVETRRDRIWCRELELRVEEVSAANRFIERVGFCFALTDAQRSAPSLTLQ